MIEIMIDWAGQSGMTKINLKVRPDNERAIRLYESFGFVREGVISREYRIENRYHDNICMGLEID